MTATVPLLNDHVLIAALGGAIITALGAMLTYKVQMRKATVDYWTALQTAQTAFQDEIHVELQRIKVERDELRNELAGVKKQVKELISQNEQLMLDKITWMEKATSLQTLVSQHDLVPKR